MTGIKLLKSHFRKMFILKYKQNIEKQIEDLDSKVDNIEVDFYIINQIFILRFLKKILIFYGGGF